MCNCFCRHQSLVPSCFIVSAGPTRRFDRRRLSDGAVIGEIAASRKQSYGGFLKLEVRKKWYGLWWINPMKSYSNGFGGTPIIPHFGEPPYAEILNVIHGQPMGCFFQGPRLVPMAHRYHPQLGRDGPCSCSWRGSSLLRTVFHPGKPFGKISWKQTIKIRWVCLKIEPF